MAAPSARDVARSVLRRVEQGDAYATLALGGELERSGLDDAGRGLATEIVYGVLRNRSRVDRALAAHAPRGIGTLSRPVLTALRVAAYQLVFLRVPAHAAVDDAVGAVKATGGARVAGFANAVLRKLASAGEPPLPAGDARAVLEVTHSLPGWLAGTLVDLLGEAEAVAAAEAFGRAPPVALRVNLARATRDDVRARLVAARPSARIEVSPLVPEALVAHKLGAIDALAPFQEGLCTVQDVAAQAIARLCGAAPGERILDACAGAGGKSTHLAELAAVAGGAARIDAVDRSRRKLDLAADTARRLGVPGVQPIEQDLTAPDAALADAYDRVLLDAPCSGLGVLRRHPELKWRPRESTAPLVALQARLLDAVAARVRPGGVLVYSVCTFAPEEGPGQIARLRAAHPRFALVAPQDQLAPFASEGGFFRSWPHRHDADGFFAARLVAAPA